MFYDLFCNLCKEKGTTPTRAALEIGLSKSTPTTWKNRGLTPQGDTLSKIADYFDVSVDYLLGNEKSPAESGRAKKKGVKIPVLGRVVAGIPIEAIEDIIDYEEITEEMASQGEFFGLQIVGESMMPRFVEGDVVIVRKQPTVDNGQIAIVLINGENATCKKVMFHANGITLISLNPIFKPMFFSNEEINELPVEIIGRVVELRGKF